MIDVRDHTGLIGLVVRDLFRSWSWHDKEELKQELFLVLDKCARGFRPEFGWQFSTYALASMKQFVKTFWHRKRRLPQPRAGSLWLFRDYGKVAGQFVLGETDEFRYDDRGFTEADARSDAGVLLEELKDRDVLVLMRRMGDDTLQEIGDDLGLTKERVRQLEAKALGELRDRFSREVNDGC